MNRISFFLFHQQIEELKKENSTLLKNSKGLAQDKAHLEDQVSLQYSQWPVKILIFTKWFPQALSSCRRVRNSWSLKFQLTAAFALSFTSHVFRCSALWRSFLKRKRFIFQLHDVTMNLMKEKRHSRRLQQENLSLENELVEANDALEATVNKLKEKEKEQVTWSRQKYILILLWSSFECIVCLQILISWAKVNLSYQKWPIFVVLYKFAKSQWPFLRNINIKTLCLMNKNLV